MTAVHTSAHPSGGLLSVAAIAAERGCDRTTAWRWLTTFARQHGARLVRQGRTLHIEASEYARLVALDTTSQQREIAELKRRYTAIEERIDLIERRLNVAGRATR